MLLVSGSVSWMYYADRLMEFPAGVLGVALGTILLPSLAKSFSKGDHKQYSKVLDWGIATLFFTGFAKYRGIRRYLSSSYININ
nr:lipid II flippase MurJ [Gilliamella apicola]